MNNNNELAPPNRKKSGQKRALFGVKLPRLPCAVRQVQHRGGVPAIDEGFLRRVPGDLLVDADREVAQMTNRRRAVADFTSCQHRQAELTVTKPRVGRALAHVLLLPKFDL